MRAEDASGTSAAGSPWRVMVRAVRLLSHPLRRRLYAAVGASAIMALLEAASFALLFLLIRVLSDESLSLPGFAETIGASTDRDSFLARCGSLVMGLFVLRALGTFLLLRAHASIQAQADEQLSTALFRRYQSMPYLDVLQRNSAEMILNVQQRTAEVAAHGISSAVVIASEGAVLSGIALTLAIVRPVLAAAVLAFVIIMATGFVKVVTPAVRRSARQEYVESGRANLLLHESMGGIKAIKANELVGPFVSRFRAQRATLSAARRTRFLRLRLPQLYLESALLLGLGLLAFVVVRTDSSEIVPTFGILAAAALRVMPSLSRILASVGAIRASESALDAVERDMQPLDDIVENVVDPNSEPSVSLKSDLRLVDVSFRYPNAAQNALVGVTLEVSAGESVGLVGPSGSGKTTLVDVVLGLLPPTSGELLADGDPLTEERLPAWRHSIGYVPQQVFLLDASLRDNIVFGRHGIDDRVEESVRLAQLADVVDALPAGLETHVGERGVRLSGGQRQRIGIARALVTRPALLILDEATAALDTKTEAEISDSLASLHGRTTTIVIAHRLSTVQNCDRIVFLEHGRVRAVGSFEQLWAQDSAFADLVRLGQLRQGMV